MAFDVVAVGQRLPKSFRHNGTTPISWAEAMRLGATDHVCGEIRGPDDLEQVPRNVALRAVAMPDGSLRWADSRKMKQVFKEAAHDYLACTGDDALPTREGYITVSASGDISVTNAAAPPQPVRRPQTRYRGYYYRR